MCATLCYICCYIFDVVFICIWACQLRGGRSFNCCEQAASMRKVVCYQVVHNSDNLGDRLSIHTPHSLVLPFGPSAGMQKAGTTQSGGRRAFLNSVHTPHSLVPPVGFSAGVQKACPTQSGGRNVFLNSVPTNKMSQE